ncbi:MAG TPA: hypothetical protein VFZ00_03045 [Solirubrobacter sp.]|nr:hypothetical protein [Solirubrobacter sp.]
MEPPRGEAAFRAHKAEIARRNELARADGAAQRAAREAGIAARELAADRLERSSYPRQPRP